MALFSKPKMKFRINHRRMEGLMRMNLKQFVWIVAMTLAIGITAGTVRVAASPSSQPQPPAQTQDYSKNKNYQVGVRDGKDDKAHNKDHSRKRNFKKDEDQKAYETGYQYGSGGTVTEDGKSKNARKPMNLPIQE